MTETSLGLAPQTERQSSDTFRRLTILHQASLAISLAKSEEDLVTAMVKQLSHSEFDRGMVILFREQDEPRGEVCGQWDRSTESAHSAPTVRWLDSAWLASGPNIFADIPHNPDDYPLYQGRIETTGVRSAAMVPLRTADSVVGTLVLESRNELPITGDLLAPYESLAAQAAAACHNQRLLEAERRRVEEAETVARITAAISGSMDLEEILHQALVELTSQCDCEAGVVGLWDETQERLSLVVDHNLPDALAAQLADGGMHDTLCAVTARGTEPHVVPDVCSMTGVDAQPLAGSGFRSFLGIPLLAQGQVLGALCLFGRPLNHFASAGSALLGTVGQQIGMTVRNALRYEEAQQRGLQIQVAADISHAASSAQDLNTLLSSGVELLRQRFDYGFVGLFLADDANKWAVLQGGAGEAGRQMLADGHRIRVAGDTTIGRAIAKGEAQVAPDLDARTMPAASPYPPDTRSELALPLISQNRVIGALAVHSREPRAFSKQIVALLQTTADQLAGAISNVRLLDQLRGSLDEIHKRERRRTRESWDAQALARGSEGRDGYEYDLMQVRPGVRMQGDSTTPTPPALVQPLVLGGEIIGELGVEADSSGYQWSEDELAIISEVATQVAQAMDRAYHSEQSERRAAQLETAARAGQAVASASTLSARELMDHAVQAVSELFGFGHVAIYLLNEVDGRVLLEAATGHAGDVMKESNYSLSTEDCSSVIHAISDRRASIVSDRDQGRWIPHPLLPETRSEIALPLLSAGRLLGALDIHSAQAAAFDQVFAAVLQTVADQIAAALTNARLFEETRQSAADQQMLFEATTVAISTADMDEMLEGVAQTIFDHMSCTDVVIMMVEGTALYRRAGFGLTSRATGTHPLGSLETPIGEGIVGRVAQTGEPIVTGDMTQSPHRTGTTSSARSELAVPILVDREVAGVIKIESDRKDAFDQKDLRLMQTLSGTLGSILKSMRLVEELQQAYEEIREVDRIKSEFLANMSHELRTPLNSIIGFSRVILKGIDGPITPLQEQDLNSIYNSGRHLLGLINNVLDLSKIEAGKMELSPEVVQIREALDIVMSTAIGLVKGRDVTLTMDVPPDIPPVWMDPIRLRQVLLNLVSNAAKFTVEGTITIQAAYDPQAVFIQVVDTGIGISEEDMDKLFRSFSQVDSSSTRRAGGSGLGLAISAQLMELQGGRIWVESQVGIGSTFSVALPRVNPAGDGPITILTGDANRTQSTGPSAAEPSEGETTPPPEPAAEKLILVIENDLGVVDLYRRYLSGRGMRLESAALGRQGIERAAELAPQLAAITVDVVMPDMDGWEIVEQLKQNESTRGIPVIICSIVLDRVRAKALGVEQYLTKPILRDDFINALETCFT
jgi:signal transduction histidine kinase/CheY-like chemotaxis protein/nitrate/nitrite-specific signal transduction histidine kinase